MNKFFSNIFTIGNFLLEKCLDKSNLNLLPLVKTMLNPKKLYFNNFIKLNFEKKLNFVNLENIRKMIKINKNESIVLIKMDIKDK
jgi:hypothetical protein